MGSGVFGGRPMPRSMDSTRSMPDSLKVGVSGNPKNRCSSAVAQHPDVVGVLHQIVGVAEDGVDMPAQEGRDLGRGAGEGHVVELGAGHLLQPQGGYVVSGEGAGAADADVARLVLGGCHEFLEVL